MTTWILILTIVSSQGSINNMEFSTEQRCREAGEAWADGIRKADHGRTGDRETRVAWICLPR